MQPNSTSEIAPPSGLFCHCGNVLGIMYRDNDLTMVMDVFRGQVAVNEFQMFVAVATQMNYSVKKLVVGNVICPKCGRSNPWNAEKRYYRSRKRHKSGDV